MLTLLLHSEQNDVSKSVSVSVAKDSSRLSDVLVCGNNSKGGAFNKLHCVATLFCS